MEKKGKINMKMIEEFLASIGTTMDKLAPVRHEFPYRNTDDWLLNCGTLWTEGRLFKTGGTWELLHECLSRFSDTWLAIL